MRTLSTTRRVPATARPVIGLLMAGAMLLALGACTKGRTSDATGTTSAGTGIATYQVSVSKFTYQGMPDTVPANTPFRIVFTNKESFEITHELVVVQIPAGKTTDDIIADTKAKGADAEDDWLHFGEIGEVNTGATGVHTFYLPEGNYAIACWQDGKAGGGVGPLHVTIGMIKGFTASASASSASGNSASGNSASGDSAGGASAAPAANGASSGLSYQVSVSKFTYQGMPDTVPANTLFSIVFTNKESFEITHEMVVVQIPAGKTVDDVIADTKAKGADAEDDWLHFGEIGEVNTGATGVNLFYLPPGNYAIACWQDGKPGGGVGPLHATIGMIKGFTVS